jgi:hypothetical protein
LDSFEILSGWVRKCFVSSARGLSILLINKIFFTLPVLCYIYFITLLWISLTSFIFFISFLLYDLAFFSFFLDSWGKSFKWKSGRCYEFSSRHSFSYVSKFWYFVSLFSIQFNVFLNFIWDPLFDFSHIFWWYWRFN